MMFLYNQFRRFILLSLFLVPFSSEDISAQIRSLDGFSEGSKNGVALGQTTWTASPTYADVDNDGQVEIILATSDGYLMVYNNDGQLRWSRALPSSTCTAASKTNRAHSSPAVADINGNGSKEIVVGYGAIVHSVCGGGIMVFDGPTGEQLSHFRTKKLLKRLKLPGASQFGVYSTPAIADTNGNGLLEFAFGSFDRNIYLFFINPKGKIKPKLGIHAADTVWSSPSLYDFNNDGSMEMFIGTDISANKFLQPPTKDGGYIYSIKTEQLNSNSKQSQKKYGFRDKKIVNWQRPVDQVVFSSPVIADVLSNPGAELIVQTGCFFKDSNGNFRGNSLRILNLKKGKVLRNIPTEACSQSQAGIGDIDGDGKLDIVITVNASDDTGQIEAYDPESGQLKWRSEDSYKNIGFHSPLIADLDNNGSPEVIVNGGSKILILNGATGEVLTQISFSGHSFATPAVGDINNDGELELIFVAASRLYVMTGFEGELNSAATDQPRSKIYTGMFRNNPARTGVYSD